MGLPRWFFILVGLVVMAVWVVGFVVSIVYPETRIDPAYTGGASFVISFCFIGERAVQAYQQSRENKRNGH